MSTEKKPEILNGKRKRKPRRVLQMHMGSSRSYGFADEDDEVEETTSKKSKKQISSPKRMSTRNGGTRNKNEITLASPLVNKKPNSKNSSKNIKKSLTGPKSRKTRNNNSKKKNSVAEEYDVEDTEEDDEESAEESSEESDDESEEDSDEDSDDDDDDEEEEKEVKKKVRKRAPGAGRPRKYPLDHTKNNIKKSKQISILKNKALPPLESGDSSGNGNSHDMMNVNSHDDDIGENSELKSTNRKSIINNNNNDNSKQRKSYTSKKARFSISPLSRRSPDSGGKKSRMMDHAPKHHAFSVQTVLKLVPGMDDSSNNNNTGNHQQNMINLLNTDKNLTQWNCHACGDLNRSDQDVCSMCFTIREINIHQFDHTGNITKLAVIDSGNNNSTNVDKEIAAITPPRIDGDNQVTTPTTEWRTSETFIRWWRRGLMTALQYKLPLLSPPVSSQPTFRHQNNGLENTLSIQPRVAKLGQDKWVQCNMCLKYRRLPASVRISDLPKMWFCRYNKYDRKHADCRASEEPFTYYDHDVKELSDDHDTLAFLDKLRHYYDVTGKVVRLRSLTLGGRELSLYRLYNEVQARGGCAQVMSEKGTWAKIFRALENYSKTETSASFRLKNIYRKYLLEYENHQRALATANNEPLPSECAAPITMMT